MNVALVRSQSRGEVFEAPADTGNAAAIDRETPLFLLSVLPIATLPGMILSLSSVNLIIIHALLVAIVMRGVFFRRFTASAGCVPPCPGRAKALSRPPASRSALLRLARDALRS